MPNMAVIADNRRVECTNLIISTSVGLQTNQCCDVDSFTRVPLLLSYHDSYDTLQMDTISESPSDTAPSSPAPNGKKSRRQVAFYPNSNSANKPQKPFSRSAAKRESVMALGSIEHLQHYFTKSGIAADSECVSHRPPRH